MSRSKFKAYGEWQNQRHWEHNLARSRQVDAPRFLTRRWVRKIFGDDVPMFEDYLRSQNFIHWRQRHAERDALFLEDGWEWVAEMEDATEESFWDDYPFIDTIIADPDLLPALFFYKNETASEQRGEVPVTSGSQETIDANEKRTQARVAVKRRIAHALAAEGFRMHMTNKELRRDYVWAHLRHLVKKPRNLSPLDEDPVESD